MSTEQDFLGNGVKFPISTKDGAIATSGGEELIRESVILILGTSKGERVMRPDFGCGINDLVFAPNSTSTATLIAFYVKEALMKWEPRIEVNEVQSYPDRNEPEKLNINITYTVKTTNTKKNLVYPFYLEGKK